MWAAWKHHSHAGFDIDYPGKDSYRHRAAGAREAVIAAPGQMACIKSIEGELECADIVRGMPGHDIVVVEGYRKSGLPTIEIMRAANESDARAASVFAEGARCGWPLGADFTQLARERVVVERGAYRAALGAGSLDTSACELAASGASDDVLGAPGEGDDRSLPSGIDCVDIVGKLPTQARSLSSLTSTRLGVPQYPTACRRSIRTTCVRWQTFSNSVSRGPE